MGECGLCGQVHEPGHPHLTMFVRASSEDPTVEIAEETFEEAINDDDMYLGEAECQSCQAIDKRCMDHQMSVPMGRGCEVCMGVAKACSQHQMYKGSYEEAAENPGIKMEKGGRCAACPGPPACAGPDSCLYKAAGEAGSDEPTDIFNPKCPLCKAKGVPCGRHKPEGAMSKSSTRLQLNVEQVRKQPADVMEMASGMQEGNEPQISGTAKALQESLTDCLALGLITHQAHWVAKGDGFHPLHELLGSIYEDLDGIVDTLAERLAALDVAPAGQPMDIAKSSLAPMRPGFADTREVTAAVSDRMRQVIERLQKSRVATGSEDPVTENILQDIIAKLQKKLWLLRSNIESASRG